jgi:hypothetical protein
MRAQEGGLLQPHSSQPIRHRLSLYADDTVLFFQPAATVNLTLHILHPFGESLGLKINIQKSNVLPIMCSCHDNARILEFLPCGVMGFPCKYLRLPLSRKRLIVGDMGGCAYPLPCKKGPTLNRSEDLHVNRKSKGVGRKIASSHLPYKYNTRGKSSQLSADSPNPILWHLLSLLCGTSTLAYPSPRRGYLRPSWWRYLRPSGWRFKRRATTLQ